MTLTDTPPPMLLAGTGLLAASLAMLFPGPWQMVLLLAGAALCAPVLAMALRPASAEAPALRDTRTGLYASAVMTAAAPAMLRMAERHTTGSCLALLLLDQPRASMAEVAWTITAGLRATDMVCRHGDEGFLILMPDCDLGGAFERLDELRARIATLDGTRRLSASVGLAPVLAGAPDLHEATRSATAAARTAIAGGRNRVVTAPMVDRLRVMQGALPEVTS
ncbi:MAG: diguanylate cyclase [Alphaproteobacteria bacterium]|nr:diguanylate cyclase [Alphaproteobacteria bacterium]